MPTISRLNNEPQRLALERRDAKKEKVFKAMECKTINGFQLSPLQKRLFYLQQNSSAFFTQCAILLEGDLQPEVLKAAIQQVINRHEILRTGFSHLPGVKTPVMVMSNTNVFVWEEVDLSNVNPQEYSDKVQELFLAARCQGLQLRLCLLKLLANQYILIISLPALYADSRTIKNLVTEISNSYANCCRGQEFAGDVVQYIQFSEWQNQLLQDEDAQEASVYWQKQKISSLDRLKLPYENKFKNKELNQEFKTDSFQLTFTPKLTEQIASLAHHYNTSNAVILLACWQILILRLTGESEIVIGAGCERREYEELQDVLGLIATWIPVKINFTPNLSFKEVLQLVEQTLENAAQWQDYFVPQSVEPENDLVFPIGFEFEDFSNQESAGVTFSLNKFYCCFEKFQVKLSCIFCDNSLIAEFHYNVNCFSLDSIKSFASYYHTLLKSAIKNPQLKISDLNILSQIDYQKLSIFNQTDIDYPKYKCIHQLFTEQAEKTPNNIAVIFENQQITYAELNHKANQLAHYLQKQGVKPEVVVGLCVEPSLFMIIGLLGILKAGAAYLPLDTTLPKKNLYLRLQEAQVSLIVSQESLANCFESMMVICLDEIGRQLATESNENPHSEVVSHNLAYVIFTSGSTGKPKGVTVEHRQVVNYLYAITDRLNLPEKANYATVSTLSADLGNTVIFPSLCRGGCLHVISPERTKDAVAFARYCQQHPIDCLKIVPSHLAALLASVPSHSILPQQRLILGGEVANWELIAQIQQQAPNCQIFNHYGPTEATIGVLTYAVEDKPSDVDTVPLGRPLANTQVYILDQHLQLAPSCVPGELYIGGAGLARGYLNQPELTATRFIYNSFAGHSARLYKTGDLGRYLEDGNIEFLGRVDNQVKIRGYRIELEEIEAVLAQHQSVRQAVVILQEEDNNKRLIAYIVPKRQASSVSDLRSFIKQKLPEYMIPSVFVFVDILPLTPNGKIDRQALPTPDIRPELTPTYEPPQTKVEETIADIWQQMLHVEKVGINDNFFDLGGHSLLLVQIHAKLRELFNVDISITHLFEYSTIRSLAKYFAQQENETNDTSTFEDVQMRAESRRNSRLVRPKSGK